MTPTHLPKLLVFDLDGVVTSPQSGEVNAQVIAAIAADLQAGQPVAFNTGRAVQWINNRILPELQRQCTAEQLTRLVVVAEKGGVVQTVVQGRATVSLDQSLTPPAEFRAAAEACLHDDQGGWQLADTMFWDAAKQTMVSIERRPDVTLAAFHQARERLVEVLQELLDKFKLSEFKLDATVIATDIEHRSAGKHAGARHILTWLGQQNYQPAGFITFGDSPSDAAMAEEFAPVAPTTFVYVGKPDAFHAPSNAQYSATVTGGGYDADTAAYLAKHS